MDRETTRAHRLSVPKLVAFSVATCVLFFAMLEGLLWAVGFPQAEQDQDPFLGFSSQASLFVESSDVGDDGVPLMETSPDKGIFFQYQSFESQKPANVRRVFCIGGSTTYGRPYLHNTSFCGWLEDFLAHTDTENEWEVINAGGISYASYRVVLLLRELVRYEPDLIISYVGQNEFLERRTYSTLLDLPKPLRDAGAAAAKLRLYALVAVALDSLPRPDPRGSPAPVHQLSKEVNTILDQSIGPNDYVRDDALRHEIVEHFRYNLEQIARITRASGAELIMVAPSSKLRNESPFKSEHGSGIGASELAAWRRHDESAREWFREKRHQEALDEVSRAETIDPRYAHTLFLKADILYALHRYADAKRAYVKARDEDVCPLRALSSMHELVLDTAAAMDVPVVDFDAIISERSPHGITDDAFFLDHVHPTIEGNEILALALLERIVGAGMIASPTPLGAESLEGIEAAKMAQVDPTENGYALTNLAMLANWGGKMREGRTLALRAIELTPNDSMAYYQAGLGTLNIGEHVEEAVEYFRKAVEIDDHAFHAYVMLGIAYDRLGREDQARESLERAVDSDDVWAASWAHFALGGMLERDHQPMRAIEEYRRTLELDPQYYNAQKRIDALTLR